MGTHEIGHIVWKQGSQSSVMQMEDVSVTVVEEVTLAVTTGRNKCQVASTETCTRRMRIMKSMCMCDREISVEKSVCRA